MYVIKKRNSKKCTQTACLYEKTLRASKQGVDEILPLPEEQVGELVCEVRLWKQVLVLHIQVDSISEEATGEDRIESKLVETKLHGSRGILKTKTETKANPE